MPKHNELLPNDFNEFILNPYFQLSSFVDVCDYKEKLLGSSDEVSVRDFGAGSKRMKKSKRKIADIAKNSSTMMRFGGVFQKIVENFDVKSVLELGTSLGVGTMCFAKTSSKTKVTTIDACRETQNYAKQQFEQMKIRNVEFINSRFDDVFDSDALRQKYDLIFLDGNHTYEATIKYFKYSTQKLCNEKYIIIVDDINWSHDMYRAWEEFVAEKNDSLRINLFRCGIIFSGYSLPNISVRAKILDDTL